MTNDQARELLNETIAIDDGPDRTVGPATLDVPNFRRRRYLARVFERMTSCGATEVEMLFAYVAALAMPIDDVRRGSSSATAWEDSMDAWFEQTFGGVPTADQLLAARKIFDFDMAAISSARVEVIPRPGAADKDAPPNSSGQSPS